MADKTPLKFEFDSTTPSSLAEFTSSDTVPLVNGGIGVSSLADFGAALSSTALSALSLSATELFSPGVSATLLLADTVLSNTVSATEINSLAFTGGTFEGASVSATDVSAGSLKVVVSDIYPIPIPAPWAFVAFAGNGTAESDEQNVGIGVVGADSESSEDHFTWDDTNKRFNVSSTGTYEITLNIVLTVASTTVVTLKLYTTIPGSAKNTASTTVHSSIDPQGIALNFVGPIAVGSYAFATTTDDAATDVTVNPGTSMTLKRLK